MLPVESLRDAEAITFDTSEMVLFDGSRCHSVTVFEGERCSLVYFTTSGYTKASTADRAMLVASAWPTEASPLYFATLLAPPKGDRQRGSRSACGSEERPAALQRSSTSLVKHRPLLQHVLAFTVAPLDLTTLCAHSKTARDTWTQPRGKGSLWMPRASSLVAARPSHIGGFCIGPGTCSMALGPLRM